MSNHRRPPAGIFAPEDIDEATRLRSDADRLDTDTEP